MDNQPLNQINWEDVIAWIIIVLGIVLIVEIGTYVLMQIPKDVALNITQVLM